MCRSSMEVDLIAVHEVDDLQVPGVKWNSFVFL
jgi:hypothetical protein